MLGATLTGREPPHLEGYMAGADAAGDGRIALALLLLTLSATTALWSSGALAALYSSMVVCIAVRVRRSAGTRRQMTSFLSDAADAADAADAVQLLERCVNHAGPKEAASGRATSTSTRQRNEPPEERQSFFDDDDNDSGSGSGGSGGGGGGNGVHGGSTAGLLAAMSLAGVEVGSSLEARKVIEASTEPPSTEPAASVAAEGEAWLAFLDAVPGRRGSTVSILKKGVYSLEELRRRLARGWLLTYGSEHTPAHWADVANAGANHGDMPIRGMMIQFFEYPSGAQVVLDSEVDMELLLITGTRWLRVSRDKARGAFAPADFGGQSV